MNIFFLDRDVRLAAEYHVDKHVVKMILESAQILSTAHRVLDGIETVQRMNNRNTKRWILNDSRETALYKTTHVNHPSAVWARSNIDHYRYLFDLYISLIDEYKYRYGKTTHKSAELAPALFDAPENIDYDAPWVDPPQAMPDDVKVPGDAVLAYRQYYAKYKVSMAKWTKRSKPVWWETDVKV
jgi:hypothetical protein